MDKGDSNEFGIVWDIGGFLGEDISKPSILIVDSIRRDITVCIDYIVKVWENKKMDRYGFSLELKSIGVIIESISIYQFPV